MSNWFWRVTENPDDYSPVADFIDYFDKEYLAAKKECPISGSVEQHAARLPGIVEHRWSQLQEIEAVLKYFNEQHKLKKGEALRKYIEKYNRALSPSVAEKYADSDPDVINLSILINQIAFTRNKFISISKGLEYKHYQLGNITKLRCAGIEEISIDNHWKEDD